MQKRYVAFLDILGFKELVNRNGLEELLVLYQSVLEKGLHMSLTVLEMAEVEKELPDSALRAMIISDSIMVWSENDSINSFVVITKAVQSMLYTSLALGMPLRGAISYGELEEIKVSHKNALPAPILLGDGLTKAVDAEKKQKWSGCIVTLECINAVKHGIIEANQYPVLKYLVLDGALITYDVPLGKGEVKREYCINWPMTTRQGEIEPSDLRNKFLMHNKRHNDDVEEKIMHTLAFCSYCWDLPKRQYGFSL